MTLKSAAAAHAGTIRDWLSAVAKHLPLDIAAHRLYGIGIAISVAALLLRLAIAPVEAGLQYVTFFPAVAISALIGGYRLGLFSMAMGVALATYFFTPPYFGFSAEALNQSLLSNIVFVIDGIVISYAIESLHKYRARNTVQIAELKKAKDNLRASNRQLSEQIANLEQAEAALLESNRHKDEFIAMLAHELRNPLMPISTIARLLQTPNLAEKDIRWASETLSDRVAHLKRLVDDLLDASRVTQGRFVLKRERVDFAEVASQAAETVRPTVETKGHHLVLQMPDRPVHLDADRVRLLQILVNLLDNAVKYTPDGGHIELAARVLDRELEVRVSDDGSGIAPDLLPKVFDLFQQGSRTLDRSQGGLGIGLSLAERLVAKHGGRIRADSPGPQRGSTFTVWLPIPETAPEAVPAAPLPAAGHPGKRVMVVDDDRLIAYSLGKILKLEGHDVLTVSSGEEALGLAAEFKPQAILLDIGLEGMDGYETARRLRALPIGQSCRLIALSGYGDAGTLAKSQAAGFDRHLIKPVDWLQLAEELNRIE